jgi:hypothetical protein
MNFGVNQFVFVFVVEDQTILKEKEGEGRQGGKEGEERA